jgi:hypothetical protein
MELGYQLLDIAPGLGYLASLFEILIVEFLSLFELGHELLKLLLTIKLLALHHLLNLYNVVLQHIMVLAALLDFGI